MVNKRIIQEWLDKADEDFEFAVWNLRDPENNFYAQICFHFQQAVEKYLKTYIIAYELLFEKIHELPQLLKICQEHNKSFSELEKECRFLTDFYVEVRYPVHWPTNYTKEKAIEAQKVATRIRDFVKSFLKY
jgi:HEPN domain-containing protein